jgi:hypothetical protein
MVRPEARVMIWISIIGLRSSARPSSFDLFA